MALSRNNINELNKIVKEIRETEISATREEINEIIYVITNERKKQKMSQSELAALTGLPQTTISRIETFVSIPTLPVLIKIMNALNLELKIIHHL